MCRISTIIDITDLRQIELVPVMRTFFTSIAFVLVFDAITERVFGTREFPGEDMRGIGRVGDHRRISSE